MGEHRERTTMRLATRQYGDAGALLDQQRVVDRGDAMGPNHPRKTSSCRGSSIPAAALASTLSRCRNSRATANETPPVPRPYHFA